MEVSEFGPKHTLERHESDIFNISYTRDGLTVLIDTVDDQGARRDLKIYFEGACGFRYLDEGDLTYYWQSEKFHSPYHLYKIIVGGWSNGESIQQNTLSVSIAVEVSEWFIATTNGCISVLSNALPAAEFVNT